MARLSNVYEGIRRDVEEKEKDKNFVEQQELNEKKLRRKRS